MSEKQYAALVYIHEYTQAHGYAPKHKEIARHVNRTPQVVRIWLINFQRMGYVTRRPGRWRGVKVVRLPGRGAA